MRFIHVITLCLCLAIMFSTTSRAASPRKRALIIGVSKYSHPRHDGLFDDLNCQGDVDAMSSALIERFQFAPADITTLTAGEDTKRERVLSTFEAFVEATQPGDIIVIYYAGHGSQVPDPREPDGVDETIVPSDYTDDGSRDITDKTIAALLIKLRGKKPQDVMLGFDCCHSATAARADNTAFNRIRGLRFQERYGKALPKPPEAGRTLLAHELGSNPIAPNFVVFAACQDDELAMQMQNDDDKPIGRLSYFLSKALLASNAQTTYADVFDRVRAMMAQRYPGQTPNIEGGKSRLLLNGTAVKSPTYTTIYVNAVGKLKARAGYLQGMTKGSEFAIYANSAHNYDTEKPLASAKVELTGPTQSELTIIEKFAPDLTNEKLQGGQAIETQHIYKDDRLRLSLEDFKDLPDGADLISAIQALTPKNDKTGAPLPDESPVLTSPEAAQNPDVRLILVSSSEQEKGYALAGTSDSSRTVWALVRSRDGAIIEPMPLGDGRADALIKILKREAIYKTVSSLNNESRPTGIRVEMRIAPAKIETENGYDIFKADLPARESKSSFHVDSWFTLEVRNTGTLPAFITILDLQADGNISQLWVRPGEAITSKLEVDVKNWHKLWLDDFTLPYPFKITPPMGVEMFKLIATNEYVDFSGLTTKAPKTPLQALIKAAMSGTRATGGVVPTSWSSSTVTIKVVPQQ